MACSPSLMNIVLLVYCIFNVVLGLLLAACGAWFHASPDVHAYMTVFVLNANDSSLSAAAALMLVSGIVLVLISVLAGVGVILKKPGFVFIHMLLEVIVIVLALIGGFIAVGIYWENHHRVKNGMRDQLQQYYEWDSEIGRAWNRVQVKKRCCGVDGSWDYVGSGWHNDNNPIDEPTTKHVPDSCCSLNFNQDRELYWVDPQNIQMKDRKRCQEDAYGRVGNSANLNRFGCYTALLQRNKDLWHDVNIFTVISIIQGLCLAAGFLQVFGMVIDFYYLKVMRAVRTADPSRKY